MDDGHGEHDRWQGLDSYLHAASNALGPIQWAPSRAQQAPVRSDGADGRFQSLLLGLDVCNDLCSQLHLLFEVAQGFQTKLHVSQSWR